MEYAITVAIILVVVVLVVVSIISTNKIKKNGVEAEAKISRIVIRNTQTVHEDTGLVDNDTDETYYVKFKHQNGEEIEALLTNPRIGLREEDMIKIKYLPEKPNKVVMMKAL